MLTDFGRMQPQKKRAWEHEAYRTIRDNLFWTKLMGKGQNAVVDRVDEIRKSGKGTASAMIHLVADLGGGAVVGDNELINRETPMQSHWLEIEIGRIRKATRDNGKLASQKSVIEFRRHALDKLAFWCAEMIDELCFLTASGIGYGFTTDGRPRTYGPTDDDLNGLEFAASVTAPSANRHFNWTGTALAPGDTTTVTSSFTPNYRMIVDIMAEADTRKIPKIKSGGREYRILLMHPKAFAALKKDTDFREAVIHARDRGEDNPIFTGATITYDGAVIHTHNKVFNTLNAASGSKWGAGGTVNGTRTLLLGAQALGFADLGACEWDEDTIDFADKPGIAISKIFGIIKPRFFAPYEQATEDYSVVAINHHIA